MALQFPISLSNSYDLECNKIKLNPPNIESIDLGTKLLDTDNTINQIKTDLTIIMNDNYIDLNGKINLKLSMLSSYEPDDQDIQQVDILHSSTQLSKITWDGAYINLYKHTDPMDERYGLLDLKLSSTFVNTVTDKYSTSMSYTKTEINSINILENYNNKITSNSIFATVTGLANIPMITQLDPWDSLAEGPRRVNLMYSTTKMNQLKGDNTSITVFQYTNSTDDYYPLIQVGLTQTFLSNITNKYTTSMSYTRTEISNLINIKQNTIEAVGSGVSLLFSGTQISKLKGYGGVTVGLDFPNADVAITLDSINISGLSNYYLKSETYSQAQIYNDYFLKADVQNTYYDKSTMDVHLSQNIYDYVNTKGNRLYDKVITPGDTIKIFFII